MLLSIEFGIKTQGMEENSQSFFWFLNCVPFVDINYLLIKKQM